VTTRTRAALLAYPLIELTTAYLVALWIGWGWTLLLLVAGVPLGLALMRNAGAAAMDDLQRAAASGDAPDQGRHAVGLLGGLLVAIPGFWTDLFGLALFLPPIGALVRRRAGSWAQGRMTTMRMPGVYDPRRFGPETGGDVVQGTVIHVEDLRSEPPQERRGEIGREPGP